jgi:hypothetical protein
MSRFRGNIRNTGRNERALSNPPIPPFTKGGLGGILSVRICAQLAICAK